MPQHTSPPVPWKRVCEYRTRGRKQGPWREGCPSSGFAFHSRERCIALLAQASRSSQNAAWYHLWQPPLFRGFFAWYS
eukprot:705750-Rhodomonas_salina.3